MALGYLSGKTSGELLKAKVNLPLIFMLSVAPDIDLLFPLFIQHRGPTHSIIMAFVVFVPFFVVYRRKAIPYFAAFVQHSLIGDYVAGGNVQLLWPVTGRYFGVAIGIESPINITLEWVFFLASMILMVKMGDLAVLLQPHNSNLILAVPTFTVLLPTFLCFPLYVPVWLILPHLIYLFMFLASMFVDVYKFLK
ncbi:MAG: metal-dependent hydrolase [Candidatus Bathyarchaeales archaeon]